MIYIGTILLNVKRWGADRSPSYLVSEWMQRFADAGFDGMELWEFHATECSDDERAKLDSPPLPITIFNTYVDLDDASQAGRQLTVDMVKRYSAPAIKYNVGKDPDLRGEYLRNLRQWSTLFSESTKLLCECHPGTIIEEADDAKAFFDELAVDSNEIIVHAFNRHSTLKQWFDLFGAKVTHAHLQMRDDDGNMVRFDRRPDIAREALHIMKEEGFNGSFTLEFTEGTRAPDENIDDLFANALHDLEFLKGIL